jgi:beta-lactamase class A
MKKRLCIPFGALTLFVILFMAFAGTPVSARPATEVSAAPAPQKADLTNWKRLISAEIAAVPYDTGVLVIDVASGDKFEYNPDKRFRSASIIKLFILKELFDQVKSGKVNLSDTITYDKSVAKDGGMLHKFSSGVNLRLEDYALFMLAVSDNTATNMFMDHLGMDNINANIQSLGAKQTILGRKMLDSEARRAGRDNFTCASDVGIVLNSFLKENNPRILDMLSLQKNRSKLPANLGFEDADDLEYVVANKTGELPPNVSHDSAIFFFDKPNPVIAVVLTEYADANSADDYMKINQYIARIGKIVYDTFKKE